MVRLMYTTFGIVYEESVVWMKKSGDTSPNFLNNCYNYMICKRFCDHAGLRIMCYINNVSFQG